MTEMNHDEMAAELARLKSENALLKQEGTKVGKLSLKVSEKTRCVSIYGLARFPCNLHPKALLKILDAEKEIREFVKASYEAGLFPTEAEEIEGKKAAKKRSDEAIAKLRVEKKA